MRRAGHVGADTPVPSGSFWSIGLLSARPALHAQGVVFQTSVAPQADEDLASDCRYEITLTNSSRTVRGVWVIFDRGRDMLRYYGDPDVQAFAERHDLALLLAFHCGAKSSDAGGDINVDPSKGIGRALFSALTQFAQSSRHAELASAKVILLGFSGAGSLAGRFPAYAPDRVLAVIAANPGHNPLGVDTIDLSRKTAAVPAIDPCRKRRRYHRNATTLRVLPQVLRSRCALDVCPPKRDAALLRHQRQGAGASVAGRGRRSKGGATLRAVWVHQNGTCKDGGVP